MNTLTILARVHRHICETHGLPITEELARVKRLVVVGLCRDMTDASISMIAAVTAETPETVAELSLQWCRLEEDVKSHWRRVVR
jgi:hypothetical protein